MQTNYITNLGPKTVGSVVVDSLFYVDPIVLWGFCVWFLFCCAVLSVVSRFCNHLVGEERTLLQLPFDVTVIIL